MASFSYFQVGEFYSPVICIYIYYYILHYLYIISILYNRILYIFNYFILFHIILYYVLLYLISLYHIISLFNVLKYIYIYIFNI